MRLYLSGPMTGKPEFNFPWFHRTAARLRGLGHEVLNPAESFEGRVDLPLEVYMREDIGLILSATAVAVHPLWPHSRGAKLEVAVARALGLPVLWAADLAPVVAR